MRFAVPLAACLALPVAAQEMGFDPAPTETCLAGITDGAQAYDCIGRAAYACMAQPMGETTLGMGFCLDAELTFWDNKLNAAYQTLRTDFATQDQSRPHAALPLAEGLRDMQRGWIGFRDARCSFEAAQWHGGTGASPAYLGCAMQMTGEQTVYLWSVHEGAR